MRRPASYRAARARPTSPDSRSFPRRRSARRESLASPVHLECRVLQILPIGDGAIAANLVIGEVLLIHIDDAVLDASGRVDPRKLRTIARLGGDFYCRSTDLFEMKRP